MTPHPYTVADVMTRKVVAVAPKASFKDIVTAMSRWSVSALPVIEGEGHVVGVVSEADLLPKEEFHERRPGLVEQMRRLDATAKAGSLSAEDLMTRPALTIGPDAPLPQAARLMATRGVKRLPVVEGASSKASSAGRTCSKSSSGLTTSSPGRYGSRWSPGSSPCRGRR